MNDHFHQQSVLKLSHTTYSIYFVEKEVNWLVVVMQMECVFWEVLGKSSVVPVPRMYSSMGES